MPTRAHLFFWVSVAAIFILAVWLLQSILLPFVMGLGIAYLLNPLVEIFEKRGYSRNIIALALVLIVILLLTLLFVTAGPVLYHQTLQFVRDLPELVMSLKQYVPPALQDVWNEFELPENGDLQQFLQEHGGSAAGIARNLAGGVLAGGQALVGIISFIVLMPIVAYFMLKEWPSIRSWVIDLMPRHHKDTILDLLGQINVKIAGFVRGQLTVMAVLGVGYAVALSIAGLNYAILIGLMSGLLSIIPMLGSFTGFVVSVAVAWFQTGELSYMAIIAAIYLVGQFVEGNFITPKLVGDSVGLHPLWVLFAVMAGGALFGIVGMLISVPVAAVIGVLIAFMLNLYKASAFYTGKKAQAKNSSKTTAGKSKTAKGKA